MFDVLNSTLRDFGNVFEGGNQLGVFTTPDRVEKECDEAIRYNYRSFVVCNSYVKLAKKLLENTGVRVCGAFSYPLGSMDIKAKKYELAQLVEFGCDSVDGVVNHCYLKTGEHNAFQEELTELTEYGKSLKKDLEVKFIVDCGYVTDEELIFAAKAVKAAKADYFKTGTGWSETSGASRHQIKLIRETVGPDFGIKGTGMLTMSAAGVVALLNAGSDIIGTDPVYAIADFPAYQEKIRNGTF